MLEGKPLAVVVGGTGFSVILLGTLILYAGEPPPTPELPKAPPPPEVTMNSTLKYSVPVYRALLETDALGFKVPVPSLEELGRPNVYFDELHGRRKLKAKTPLETQHLRLSLAVARKTAHVEGQSYAVDHLILRIENRSGKYLAYRVQTAVADKAKCASMGVLAHNALVLEPHETIQRAECLYRADESLEVSRAEVIELLPLEAYYVSRLPPNPILYDARTSGGHVPLAGTVCPQTFSWREIQEGLDRQVIGWKDVIDFYARHNCDEYSFFKDYRFRSTPGDPLPARPLD
jgi:hypothetical protein